MVTRIENYITKIILRGVTFKMKKIFLIFLLGMMIILAISVVGFAEGVVLRFYGWGGPERISRTQEVIELFEEKYPNVKIEPEWLGYGEYYQKMAVQAAGRNLPDIFQQDNRHILGYIDYLLNLNPYIEDNTLDLTDINYEMIILPGSHDGKVYGISLGSNADCYIYDPELFKKAGIEEPTPEWTFEDYAEKAKKINKALGIYADDPYGNIFNNIGGLCMYVRQHGKEVYDISRQKLGYEDDKLFADYFSKHADLIKDGVNTPPEISLGINHSAFGEWLITKKEAAMTPISSNQLVAIVEAAGRPLSLVTYPNAVDQVRYGTFIKASMFVVAAKNTKYPEWAVKFIDFCTNDLEANKILLAERGVPPSSKIREGIMPYLTDTEKQMIEFVSLLEEYSTPLPEGYYFPEENKKVMDVLSLKVLKILYGKLTPEEAAKEFREEANKILAEN